MLRLVEDGEMFRLRRHWDARKPECIESAKHTTIHVGIKEFSCALVVLTIGVVASLSILTIEIALKRNILFPDIKWYTNKKKPKQQNRRPQPDVILPYVN